MNFSLTKSSAELRFNAFDRQVTDTCDDGARVRFFLAGYERPEDLDPELKKLLDSEDERERRAGEGIKRLLDSEDESENRQGQRLVAMIKNGGERERAIRLTEFFAGSNQLRKVFEILDDKRLPDAAKRFAQMLDAPPESNGLWAAGTLVSLLTSTESDERNDGRYLQELLNHPDNDPTAERLLTVFAVDRESLHQALALLRDDRRKEATDEFLKLLKKDEDCRAAVTLLKLLARTDTVAHADTLVSFLKKDDHRSFALGVLSGLSDSVQIAKLLEMHDKPEWKVATRELIRMLASEEDQNGAVKVLDLLTSRQQRDREDGERLRKMLNSDDEVVRHDAARLMRLIGDVEHRHYLLGLLSGEGEVQRGARRVLELLESPGRRDRERAYAFVELLGHGCQAERQAGLRLVRMLGGDDQQRGQAQAIIRELHDDGARMHLLEMIESPKQRAAGQQLLADLNGRREHCFAARAMLDFIVNRRGIDADGAQLLKMLTDDHQRDRARSIVRNLGGPSEISTFLRILNDGRYKDARVEVVRMVGGSDDDKRAIRTLLQLMGADDTRQVFDGIINSVDGKSFDLKQKTGEQLIMMLGKADQRDDARLILTRLDSPVQMARLLGVIGSERYKSWASVLLAMLRDDRQAETARLVLKSMPTPEQTAKMLEILGSKQFRLANYPLQEMMRENKGAAELMSKLTVKDDRENKVGTEILQLLNDEDRRNRSLGEELAKSGLPVAETIVLKGLLTAKEHRWAGSILAAMTGFDRSEPAGSEERAKAIGARLVLSMLASGDESSVKAGQQIRDMLDDPKERTLAVTLISKLVSPFDGRVVAGAEIPELKRLAQALSNAKEREGAIRLIALFDREDLQEAARTVAGMLVGADPGRRGAGQKLLELLSDEEQHQYALAIMSNIEPISYPEFFKLTVEPRDPLEKEAGKQLVAMMKSGDASQLRGVRNLMTLLLMDSSTGRRLVEALGDEKKRGDARNILSNLERPALCGAMVRLVTAPGNEGIRNVLLELLRSKDRGDHLSVNSLLQLRLRPVRRFLGEQYGDTGNGASAFIAALNDPKLRDLAGQALRVVKTPQQAALVDDMLASPDHHEDLQKLLKLAKGEQTSQAVSVILDRLDTRLQVREMISLMESGDMQGVNVLVSMLQDVDNGGVVAARRLVTLLADPDESSKKAAKLFLEMLRNPDTEERAVKVLFRLGGRGAYRVAQIMSETEYKEAADSVIYMLDSENFQDALVVSSLFDMLGSEDAATRSEAERILRLLNDSAQKYAGMRLLRLLRRQNFGER